MNRSCSAIAKRIAPPFAPLRTGEYVQSHPLAIVAPDYLLDSANLKGTSHNNEPVKRTFVPDLHQSAEHCVAEF